MNIRQKERAQRIIWMKEYVANAGKDGKRVGYKEMIGNLVIHKYLSYRVAKEDVDAVIASGFFIKVDDEIAVPEEKIIGDILET